MPRLDLTKIALVNQSDSYITFPGDIGNLEPLVFEANINPNFIIRERADSRLMAVLTPQVRIRMYNEESYPVQTPSYIPQISVYHLITDTGSLEKTALFGKIAHHSNGQDDHFYTDSTSTVINYKSGNFATNFLEFGILRSFYHEQHAALRFFKSSLEIHPSNWMLKEMKGTYSGLRWHNSFLAYKMPVDKHFFTANRRASFSVKIETSLMLDNINDWELLDLNRLNAALTIYYHPKFLEDIGLFVQFYKGSDYYNIYYNHNISTIRFGLMTEILRF
ncbi:hypothetical protein FK178_13475 [Antarcticibacterium arcticum]|uniref:Phosphatidylcholine 1-acylhydrolase n=1 Tax=Antarcticibacterium arcticum TaxID=2585771 RepID=A0A5B8YQE0_9FLAO|nr:hypothetical protein FK178_13475 [Antarcticibacterium arcticum]